VRGLPYRDRWTCLDLCMGPCQPLRNQHFNARAFSFKAPRHDPIQARRRKLPNCQTYFAGLVCLSLRMTRLLANGIQHCSQVRVQVVLKPLLHTKQIYGYRGCRVTMERAPKQLRVRSRTTPQAAHNVVSKKVTQAATADDKFNIDSPFCVLDCKLHNYPQASWQHPAAPH
jgi:hypothetical protein